MTDEPVLIAPVGTDSLADFKPLGWYGFGHFHWYTENDPTGKLACSACNPEGTR